MSQQPDETTHTHTLTLTSAELADLSTILLRAGFLATSADEYERARDLYTVTHPELTGGSAAALFDQVAMPGPHAGMTPHGTRAVMPQGLSHRDAVRMEQAEADLFHGEDGPR